MRAAFPRDRVFAALRRLGLSDPAADTLTAAVECGDAGAAFLAVRQETLYRDKTRLQSSLDDFKRRLAASAAKKQLPCKSFREMTLNERSAVAAADPDLYRRLRDG